jgi:hypothetical protein
VKHSFHFSFLIFRQLVGLLRREINPSQGLYLHTGQHKQNKRTQQTSMPEAGFEPTITTSERAKTVHVLDRSATVTGTQTMVVWTVWTLVGLISRAKFPLRSSTTLLRLTERHAQVVITPTSYSRRPTFKSRPQHGLP